MTLRGLTVAVGVLVVASGLVACGEDPAPPANPAPVIVPGKPGEPASTIAPGEADPAEVEPPNDADVEYVRDMIVHHQQAIDMSVLAPERAADTQVKELASRIAETQGPEIDMMNRWLSRHDKPIVDPTAHEHADHSGMPGMATPERMAQLRDAKGQRFDTLFLETMIAHHEGALTMASEVQTSGADQKVREWAADVKVTQADEIARMNTMLGG